MKEMIERLRNLTPFNDEDREFIYDVADALERLTQPVELEPVAGHPCHECGGAFDAAVIARLQQELEVEKDGFNSLFVQFSKVIAKRDELLAVLKQYDKLTSHDGWYADLVSQAIANVKGTP